MKCGTIFWPATAVLLLMFSFMSAQEDKTLEEGTYGKKVKIITVQPDGTKQIKEFDYHEDVNIESLIKSATESKADEYEQEVRILIDKEEGDAFPFRKMVGERKMMSTTVKKLGIGLVFDDRYENNLIIQSVIDNSPAKDSGLKSGDVLLSVEGSQINRFEELKEIIEKKEDGDRLKVEFLRYGKKMKVRVNLRKIEFPTKAHSMRFFKNDVEDFNWLEREGVRLGVILSENIEGLEVITVLPNSLAEKLGIKLNDVLEEINDQKIKTIGDLQDALRELEEGDDIDLRIKRKVGETIALKGKV